MERDIKQNGATSTPSWLTETALRLSVAMGQVPLASLPNSEAMHQWLGGMIASRAIDEERRVELGTSLAADLHRLRWQMTDIADALLPRLTDFMDVVGIDPAEKKFLDEAMHRINPARLGGWIEIKAETGALNTGWYIPDLLPFPQVHASIIPSQAREQLGKWAVACAIKQGSYLGRAVGGGDPYTEIRILLPSMSIQHEMEAALLLFDALQVPSPPDMALAMLLHYVQGGLVASLWLSSVGVVKVGLLAPRPSTMLLLQLCQEAGVHTEESLAAFEGALGVQGATYLECQPLATGFSLELHYDLEQE